MRIASIDIGTNTVLMLIADVSPTGELTVVRDEHAIVRLGKSVDGTRRISADGLERLVNQLLQYVHIAQKEGCGRIVATGTSALRDAVNREEVLLAVTAVTGLEIRILSGDQEADLTFKGAVSGLRHAQKSGEIVVLDIGGGSTEIVKGTRRKVIYKRSVDVGAVRLTERYWEIYPAQPEAIVDCRSSIGDSLGGIDLRTGRATWVGVAGTVTTCAAIVQKLTPFDAEKINGSGLRIEDVEGIWEKLSVMSLEELQAHPQIHPDRADIIMAGVAILREVMKRWRVEEIVVSTRGLRYGAALGEIGN